jgi:hypothetical protein
MFMDPVTFESPHRPSQDIDGVTIVTQDVVDLAQTLTGLIWRPTSPRVAAMARAC